MFFEIFDTNSERSCATHIVLVCIIHPSEAGKVLRKEILKENEVETRLTVFRSSVLAIERAHSSENVYVPKIRHISSILYKG